MNNEIKFIAENYRIADAHAHIFPPKVAERAVKSIGDFYDSEMRGTGLAEGLLKSGEQIGTEKYLVCSTATRAGQVQSINDFIFEECAAQPKFLGFATLHPEYEEIDAEVERIVKLGLHGIKLHPDFQKFDIDSPQAMPIYQAAQRAGLPILFHMGDVRYDYSAPERLAEVAQKFPRLTCIAAHLGGYQRWNDAEKYLGQPNIYYDTSSSLFVLHPDEAVSIIKHFGSERFMFGTDYPMWLHEQELERFFALPLSEKQREDILWNNFAGLLL
ncbi:MAG: amidohydrolase family protein [Angelakisella sp.]